MRAYGGGLSAHGRQPTVLWMIAGRKAKGNGRLWRMEWPDLRRLVPTRWMLAPTKWGRDDSSVARPPIRMPTVVVRRAAINRVDKEFYQ